MDAKVPEVRNSVSRRHNAVCCVATLGLPQSPLCEASPGDELPPAELT